MTVQSVQSNTLHHRHCVKRLMERRVAVFKIARNVTINVTRSIPLKINLYQINLRTFLESDVKEEHQCQIFTDQQKVRRLAEVLKK